VISAGFVVAHDDGAAILQACKVDSGGGHNDSALSHMCEPCPTAGCDLDYIPANSTFSFTQGDFYQCNDEPAQRYLLGYYSHQV
jgi:hypothetical protein